VNDQAQLLPGTLDLLILAAGRKRLREETYNWNRACHCDRRSAGCTTGGSMRILDSLRFRVGTLMRRSDLNAEMEDELRSDISIRADRPGALRFSSCRSRAPGGHRVRRLRELKRNAGRTWEPRHLDGVGASQGRGYSSKAISDLNLIGVHLEKTYPKDDAN